MKTLLLALFTWGLCTAQTVATDSIRSKFPLKPKLGFVVSYAYYLPKGYNSQDKVKKWPIYIVLHGKGEKSWNYNRPDGAAMPLGESRTLLTNTWMIGSVIAKGIDPKAIIIQPRSPFGGWDYPTLDGSNQARLDGDVVNDILDKVIPKFNVDTNNMYLTGGSEGGASVCFYYCSTKPTNDRFAAYISIAGWPPTELSKVTEVVRKVNKGRGIALVHNIGDGTIKYDGNVPFVNSVNALKPKEPVIGCWVNTSGHDAWHSLFRNENACFPNVYEWFLAHGGGAQEAPADTVIHDTIVVPTPKIICDSLQATVWYSSKSLESGFWKICNYTQNFRVDSISYNWGANGPFGGRKDSVYAKIYGRCKVANSGNYTFSLFTDDGSNLWINDKKVISDYTNHGVRERTATVSLISDTWFKIGIDYYESGYDASLKAMIAGPEVKKQVIKRK